MKKFILFTLIGLTSTFFFAQSKLSGTLTDSHSKIPLFGVNIYIVSIQKGTTTDDHGSYELKNIPKGTFKVSFEYLGYKTINKSINFNKLQIHLSLELEISVLEMNEVIISTPFNKIQSENVVKVVHKKIKNLLNNGGITLMEGLATIPGVGQLTSGTGISKPIIRGLSGNRVLVYAQGVRLENQQFGNDHGLGVNEAGVGSVEIIKGPASLLYGSDALGGVIYLNPERFNDANTTSFNIEGKYFSNTQGTNISSVFKTSSEHLKFLARSTYNTHIDYELPNGDRVTNSRYREYDIKTAISFHNNYLTSTLRYNYNNFLTGIPEDISIQTTQRTPTFPKQKVENHILSLHNKFFFNNSKLDVNLGYIFNDRNEFEDNAIPTLRMQLKTLEYDVKYYLPKGEKIESIIGFQGLHQTNTNKATEILIPNATINDFGVFGTVNYEWKKQALQSGLRFDTRTITSEAHLPQIEALDKNFTSFNASLGYKTDFNDNLIGRLNIATGFRAPNLAELTSNGIHEGTNRFEIGNPDLKNEQNLQIDIDLSYNNKHIEVFINGFYNNINNYIFITPTGQQLEQTDVFIYEQNDAYLYGGEIGFHWHPHPLDWLHLESSFETVTGKEKDGGFIPLIPANTFKNSLRFEINERSWLKQARFSININHTLKQNKPSDFETTSATYTLTNLNFNGTLKVFDTTFDLVIAATNLFNTTYISHTSFLKTLDIPNTGRNISIGIQFGI